MLQGAVLVCLALCLPGQPGPGPALGSWDFDLFGRFNRENREQRLKQYATLRASVEMLGGKLTWTEAEVRLFAEEKGLMWVPGTIQNGLQTGLGDANLSSGCVLWKTGTPPPMKGSTPRVELRLITGGDDKILRDRWLKTRAMLQEQGFQEAYGYNNSHFQRLIGSLPQEKLSTVLRSMNRDAAGPRAQYAPVSLILASADTSFSPVTMPFPPQGWLRKMPPPTRRLFAQARGDVGVAEPDSGPAIANALHENLQPGTGGKPEASEPILRWEVILNRVVSPSVGETTKDLPWWSGLGKGAVLEGRIGPILTIRATRDQAIRIANEVDVSVIRIPKDIWRGSSTSAGDSATESITRSIPSLPGTRVDYRSGLVVVVHDNFQGWDKSDSGIPSSVKLLDLTRERNVGFVPDPYPNQETGDGTRMASMLAKRGNGIRMLLVRIDSNTPTMLGRVLHAMQGELLIDGQLGGRVAEASTETAELNSRLDILRDEEESLFQSAEGDTDDVVKRKVLVRDRIAATKRRLIGLGNLDRLIQHHRAYLLELSESSVVLCGLAWAEGHPMDGSATLSRYLDDALRRKILWFQSTPDLSSMVWSGVASDSNQNNLLEFIPGLPGNKAHDAEFLPIQWGSNPLVRRNLDGVATIRFTLQWREALRAELVQNYPRLLDEPIQPMRLLVVRKTGGDEGDTVWTPVGIADGTGLKILQDSQSATWEQELTVKFTEPGEYALRIEGTPPADTAPASLASSRASRFQPKTKVRILSRTLEGNRQGSLALRGIDLPENPDWLAVPSQARRVVTVSSRLGLPRNLIEPDRRNKPEVAVAGDGTERTLLLGMAFAAGQVIDKLARGESPEQLDWLMHRQHGWIPVGGLSGAIPMDLPILPRILPNGAP